MLQRVKQFGQMSLTFGFPMFPTRELVGVTLPRILKQVISTPWVSADSSSALTVKRVKQFGLCLCMNVLVC